MFKSDQPILSYKEDKLGRYTFAQSLGNAILSYREKESVVVGLFGAWGTGKTSIINMTIEHIDEIYKKEVKDKPIIVRFNPWNYSDQNQLITQFFNQLSVLLKKTDYAKDAKMVGEKFETYAKFFAPLTLIPSIGPVAGIISKVMQSVGGTAHSWGSLKSSDLNGIREELNTLLINLPYKIIIVIDDIDRLNNIEIRQIFQLIKSIGDFPNTVYLLAFDKNIVINALQKVQEGSGNEYLEKMLQIPFEIPQVPVQDVEKILFSQIDEIIKDIPKDKWDSIYWGNLYHSGLKYFFKNIRDVTRYINSLRFGYEIVKGEVNAIDFIAITGLQVFLPDVYYGIRDNKSTFTGVYPDYGNKGMLKEQDKKTCDKILNNVNFPSQEVLIDFLKRIFPKLEATYGNTHYGYNWISNWRKSLRICSSDNFDTYFRLTIPNGEISQKEMEILLFLGSDPELFSDATLKLCEDGKIIRFLERLEDYTHNEIPEENIKHIINVLMDNGDFFPDGYMSFTSIDTPMRLLRIFHQLCHRFSKHEERYNLLKQAIEDSNNSIYTIVHEISVLGQQHGKYGTNEEPDPLDKLTVTAEQLLDLEQKACFKIETWASDGRLAKHKHLVPILYRWNDWGLFDKINEFIETYTRTDKQFIDFITSFLSKSISHSIDDYTSKVIWRLDLESIKKFFNLEEVESRIRKICNSSDFQHYNEQNKLAITTFLDTYDGKLREF